MNRISKCMLAAAVLAVATDGLAQDQMQSPAIHANRGQSSAQQSRDADSCAVMARKRSGVDPTVLAANSTPLQEGKGLNIQPIDQPTMAMGSSGGGATGAGTGDMSQGGQMGSSGAGATGSSGGQMSSAQAGAMGSSGSSGTGATGSSAMGGQAAGSTGSSGMAGSSSASADMGASGTSGAMGATGAGGAAGESGRAKASSGASGSTGTTGAGHPAGKGRSKLAMVTADDYNAAFSKCMSSRGYTVESSGSGN